MRERFLVKLSINNHIVGLVRKNHIIRTYLMYHAADVFQLFIKASGGWVKIKLKLSRLHVSDTCVAHGIELQL